MSLPLDSRAAAGGSGPRRAASGTQVGPWRLQSPIGEGGMGVVQLAAGPDGRRVALKMLRPHVVSDTESRERLAREVALLGRVDSPRVAAVLDADPWAEVPWVATRYVPGWSLDEHVRTEGPLVGRDLRWFARCLAEALEAVHATGVVHRDVKPANILLEGRSPVLIDFGLARLADDSRLTQAGFLMGTPGYLAPEVLTGAEATPAADVHAFGACLAYAATGRAPFGRGPAVAVMDRVRRGEHDLDGVDPGVRPMVVACLHPDPARRPSAATLVAALRSVPDTDEAAYAPVRAPGQVQPASVQRAPDPGVTMPLVVARVARETGRLPTLRHRTAGPTRREEPPTRRQEPPTRRMPLPAPLTAPPTGPPVQRRVEPRPGALLGSLRAGLVAVVVCLFLAAPWTALLATLVVAHALRTWSWTAQSRRERIWRRGRRRWYDRPAAVLSTPWYAVVALGGTSVLALWAVGAVGFVGGVGLLLAAPRGLVLALAGGTLAAAMVRGPATRRVRSPLDRGVRRLSASPAASVVVLGVLALLVAVLAFAAAGGPDWAPWGSPLRVLR